MEIAGQKFEGVFEDHSEVADRRGVYIVLCMVDNHPHCVLDIGESSKVGDRLKTNSRKKCWIDNVHGEIGFCVQYTSSKGGIGNARQYAPPFSRKSDSEYDKEKRHKVEDQLQWKLEYACGENPWKKIEDAIEIYSAFEEELGPRGSYQL